jgi:hypothetical protein
VLAHHKCNVAALAPSLVLAVEEVAIPGGSSSTARVRTVGESDHTGRTLLGIRVLDEEEKSAVEEAMEFLTVELANGPQPGGPLGTAARQVGISEITLKRAKKKRVS